MSFSDLGYEKAQLEIQQHEEQSPLAIHSEIKPFTTKALFMSLKHWIQLRKNLACLETHLF